MHHEGHEEHEEKPEKTVQIGDAFHRIQPVLPFLFFSEPGFG